MAIWSCLFFMERQKYVKRIGRASERMQVFFSQNGFVVTKHLRHCARTLRSFSESCIKNRQKQNAFPKASKASSPKIKTDTKLSFSDRRLCVFSEERRFKIRMWSKSPKLECGPTRIESRAASTAALVWLDRELRFLVRFRCN